ncbi:N-acetyltransferase [Mycetocola tolaasinivorans]|uniref:N-acetyltransferase n=1 Tax=Mycetocola tolaasinivorans TaxID=76635 RepID=A0A3L7A4H9_9MICO|nr:GNAT family N-acetyltransferase [Mycetocola tolaasinivorans]RLP74965.1 N-acetyltransferase [Mycetocola tolaasinivorans]
MDLPLPPSAPTIPIREDLRLRPWRLGDEDVITAACQDPEIQRWTTIPVPYTRENAEFFLEITASDWASGAGGSLALVDPREDVPFGSFGFVSIRADHRASEIGYWLAPDRRGHGYAIAAVTALSEYALGLVGLDEVYLRIDPQNVASVAVALGAGYELTATAVTDARTPDLLDTYTRYSPRHREEGAA